MRAIVAHRLGEPDVLEVAEMPAPTADPGGVVVAVAIAGVNFAETERRRGVYRPPTPPWIPGGEGAGTVAAIGAGVDPQWLGRRVAFWALEPATSGSYAELCRAPLDGLLPLPDTLDFTIAAALPLQGLTAYGVVHFAARVRAGQTVLIQAAGGGVGLLAVQLARLAGARVLGVASSDAKRQAIAAAGGEPFEAGDDLGARVRAATDGRGVDVVLDGVGRATQKQSLEALAPFGHVVFFGEASGPAEPIDLHHLYDRSLGVSAYLLNAEHLSGALENARRHLIELASSGELKPTIDQIFPLAEAAQAHRRLESRAAVGKVLLRVQPAL